MDGLPRTLLPLRTPSAFAPFPEPEDRYDYKSKERCTHHAADLPIGVELWYTLVNR